MRQKENKKSGDPIHIKEPPQPQTVRRKSNPRHSYYTTKARNNQYLIQTSTKERIIQNGKHEKDNGNC